MMTKSVHFSSGKQMILARSQAIYLEPTVLETHPNLIWVAATIPTRASTP